MDWTDEQMDGMWPTVGGYITKHTAVTATANFEAEGHSVKNT